MSKATGFTVLQEMDRLKESAQRRKGVNSAVVSFQLEGIEPTPAFLALAERFIHLEMDGDEFEALAEKLS